MNFNIFWVFQKDEYVFFIGREGGSGGRGYDETVDIFKEPSQKTGLFLGVISKHSMAFS